MSLYLAHSEKQAFMNTKIKTKAAQCKIFKDILHLFMLVRSENLEKI